MGLKIMRANDGTPRDTWYARFTRNGQKVNVNLGVPIRGTIPTATDEAGRTVFDLASKGDAAFEKSRAAAAAAMKKMQQQAKTTGDGKEVKAAKDAEQAARYYRARTGRSVKGVRLADLPQLWAQTKRSYTPTEDWSKAVATWFDRFAKFADRKAAEHGGRCLTVNEITPEIAAAWFEEIKGSFAWETVTKQMSVLRNAYARYATSGKANPFGDIIIRNRETGNTRTPHKPLDGKELARLLECAAGDAEIYPLVVAAACTGMRIGDVCNLKWADIDMDAGLISCVTEKAGVPAVIPIFNRLREVLVQRQAIPADGTPAAALVFPRAAERYASNPDGIYKAVKPYFARALFADERQAVVVNGDGERLSTPALAEVIDAARFSDDKRRRVLEVYDRFKRGERSKDIAEAMGLHRSQVSMDLREAEKLTGENLRPRKLASSRRKSISDLIEKTRAPRAIGKRAASIYGWHSLRATFVVLAHEAGVPLADIARVVGHTQTDMTMQYFNPEKKHAAERVRRQLRGTALDTTQAAAGAVTKAELAKPSLEQILDGMSRDEIKAFMLKLAARI